MLFSILLVHIKKKSKTRIICLETTQRGISDIQILSRKKEHSFRKHFWGWGWEGVGVHFHHSQEEKEITHQHRTASAAVGLPRRTPGCWDGCTRAAGASSILRGVKKAFIKQTKPKVDAYHQQNTYKQVSVSAHFSQKKSF